MQADSKNPSNPINPSGEQIGDQNAIQLIMDELNRQGKTEYVTRLKDLIKAGKLHQEADILVALAGNPQALQAYLTLTERPVTPLAVAEETLTEDLWKQMSGKTTRVSFPATPQLDISLSQVFQPVPLDQIVVKESYAHFEPGRPLAAIYYELGHALQNTGRLPEAVNAFQSAVREDPSNANLMLHLAQANQRLENYGEALRTALQAVLLEPMTADQVLVDAISFLGKLNDRGRSLADWLEGEWAKKVRDIRALKDHVRVLQFLGTASLYRADYAAARDYFSAALDQKEDDLYTLEWLGEALLRLAQPEEAGKLLQGAYELAEERNEKQRCIGIGLKLARAWIDQEQPDQAISLLERCQPDKAALEQAFAQEYHLALGQAFLSRGNADMALSQAIKALKIQPGQIDAVALSAAAYFELERIDEARQLVDEILSVDPECLQAIWVDAQILSLSLDEQDWKVAIYRLRQYLQCRPRHARAQRLLIDMLEKDQRQADEIAGALREAIAVLGAEQAVDLEWKLANLLATGGSPKFAQEALEELETMVQRDPEQQNARWWLLKGRAELQAEQFEAALTSFEAGLKLQADNLDLLDEKGKLLLELGLYGEAATTWAQLSEYLPDHGYPRYHQAKALDLAGETRAAFDAIQEALRLGFEYVSNLELEAYDLQASLAEKLGLGAGEQAIYYLEAGKHYHWQSSYPEAIERLQRAVNLDSELVEAYWYLSEDLRLLSYTVEPPYVDGERARQSWQTWEKGYALTTLNEKNAWILLSRALLAEQLGRLRDFNPIQEYWMGVSLLERFLLWDRNELSMATLARLHRFLSNEASALDTAREAYKRYADERSVIDELVAILANTGQYEEALDWIAKLGDLAVGDWLRSVKAFILVNQSNDPEQQQEALSLMDGQLQVDANNLWVRTMRAGVHRRLGDLDSARSDYAYIWERRLDERFNIPGNETYFAWCGLMLAVTSQPFDPAYLPEVREWYTRVLPLIANPGYILGDMAMCELAMGDIKSAAERLEEAIPRLYNLREVDDLLDSFKMFAEFSQAWEHGEAARQVLAEFQPQVIARREEVRELPHPVIEVDRILQATKPPAEESIPQEEPPAAPAGGENQLVLPYWLTRQPDEVRQWAYLATSLAMARLATEYQYWREAVGSYVQLFTQAMDTGWPAGIINDYLLAIDKSFLGMQDDCDARFRNGDLENALSGYEYLKGIFEAFTNLAMAIVGGEEAQMEEFYGLSFLDPAQHARLLARLGYYRFLSGENLPGREMIYQADQLFAKRGFENPGHAVGESLAAILQDVEDYWQLDQDWQDWADQPGLPPGFQRDLQAARQALSIYLNQAYQLGRKPIALFASPLRIWLESSLLSESQSGQASALQNSYLPELRERLLSQFGFAIPMPLLNELPGWSPGSFVISLNDVPTIYDQVRPGKIFCLLDREQLTGMGVAVEELEPRPHPYTGQECCWLPAEYLESLPSLTRASWLDGDQYILLCLEALVIPNLGRLFGIDELEDLLKGWSQQGNLGQLIEDVAPGKTERIYLLRLLRNLIQSRVSITRARTILETFRHFVLGEMSFEETETRVRYNLRALLPGNQPGAVCKEMPTETEASMVQYIHRLNNRSILAAPMGAAIEWIKTLAELGNKLDLRTCVVVEDARLRPALEYLFRLEAPGWTVMTQAELISYPG